jgi:hypothetical protein
VAVATGIYVVVAAVALVWWMSLGRGTTFLYDEWDFILGYHQDLWGALITPHNGQLDVVTVIVYRAMFALFGIGHYWPYRLVGILFELAMTTVMYVYLARRARPLVALVATVALMANGQAWEDILWPVALTFTASLAAGVGALILLDRKDKARDVGAAICLAVSVISCGFGLVFLAGVGVEMVWSALSASPALGTTGHGRGNGLRRLWVVVPALVLYLSWYFHGHVGDAVFSSLHEVPRYVAQSAGYGIGSLVGSRGLLIGEVLAVLVALALAARLVLDWRSGSRLVMAIVAPLTFWALVALARTGVAGPGTSRYLQPDGLFVLLA